MSYNRREFITTGVGAYMGYQFGTQAQTSKVGKPRLACIGVGSRGNANLKSIKGAEIVALCDVDSRVLGNKQKDLPEAKAFADYRTLLRQMKDEIDGVVISTPDHTHFHATMMAMSMGKHVYVEKPLAHSIGEIRKLMQMAQDQKVVTQMGNQGRSLEGMRLIREWYEAGLIGDIVEVKAWTNRPEKGTGFKGERKAYPEPTPLPENLNWDLWVGPNMNPPEYANKHFHPTMWRGWWEFGMGALGDIGCHTLDAPFWCLDLDIPNQIDVEVNNVNPIHTPAGSVVKYHCYSKSAKQQVPVTWYEGPKLPEKLEVMGDARFEAGGGMIMVGTKGVIYHPGMRPNSPRLYPDALWQEFRQTPEMRPDKTYPRIKGSHMDDWLRGITGDGPRPCSNLDYAGPLTELIVLGSLAIRTGQSIDYDVKGMTVKNNAAAQALLDPVARAGFRADDLS